MCVRGLICICRSHWQLASHRYTTSTVLYTGSSPTQAAFTRMIQAASPHTCISRTSRLAMGSMHPWYLNDCSARVTAPINQRTMTEINPRAHAFTTPNTSNVLYTKARTMSLKCLKCSFLMHSWLEFDHKCCPPGRSESPVNEWASEMGRYACPLPPYDAYCRLPDWGERSLGDGGLEAN